MTHRVAELNNQLVEMTDPVIHTDSCVPKIHLMLQNCHNYFPSSQSYLEISINQICERNYLHRFFSDSSNFPLNSCVPANDRYLPVKTNNSKWSNGFLEIGCKNQFYSSGPAEGLECTGIGLLKVTVMTTA